MALGQEVNLLEYGGQGLERGTTRVSEGEWEADGE